MLSEPDVTLTDWGLAVECGLFAWLAPRQPAAPAMRRWLTVFFASIALAAAVGGAVHGFLPDGQAALATTLWRGALLAVGLTALAAWGVGSAILWSPARARGVVAVAAGSYVIYAGIVLLVADEFVVALFAYAPAAMFLLVALLAHWQRERDTRTLTAVAGLVVLLGGASVQWLEISAHPVYLTHNALFHLVEIIALALIFVGTRTLAPQPRSTHPCPD